MKLGMMVGIGAGAVTTYALMSNGMGKELERTVRKSGKKLMNKLKNMID